MNAGVTDPILYKQSEQILLAMGTFFQVPLPPWPYMPSLFLMKISTL